MYRVIGPLKTRAFRVIWMLEELGLPYDHDPQVPRSAEVQALNPGGKVPVLIDGNEAITDSTAILSYLADKHQALSFDAGTLDRARQDAWMHLILDELDAALWVAARHSFVLPPDMRVPAVKPSLKWEFSESLARLAGRVGDGWLMGDRFTIPDLLLTHCLTWARSAKFEVTEPALLTYLGRVAERPAYQRTLALM